MKHKEFLLIIISILLLLVISVYNFYTYNNLKTARDLHSDKSIFEHNCHISASTVSIGEISNIVTFILSLFLLLVVIVIHIR